MADKYGEFFTWSGSPRAKIFARDHSTVHDITSMVKLMRWGMFLFLFVHDYKCVHVVLLNIHKPQTLICKYTIIIFFAPS